VGFTARALRLDGQPRRSVAKATRQLSNDQLLEMLTGLYRAHGYLTRQLINAAEGIIESFTSCGCSRTTCLIAQTRG
jgi:dihydroxyacetone kinase